MAGKRDDPTDVTGGKPPSASVLQMRRDAVDDEGRDSDDGDETAERDRASSGAASHPSGDSSRSAVEQSPGASEPDPASGPRWRPGQGSESSASDPEAEQNPVPQYAPLLAALEEECRQIIQTAEADADQIRQSAEQYRAAVVAEAHRASEAIWAAAERERDGVLQAASSEISHWLDEFEQECRRWVDRSRQAATESEPQIPGGTGPATPPR